MTWSMIIVAILSIKGLRRILSFTVFYSLFKLRLHAQL
jgi:hypothetical protein